MDAQMKVSRAVTRLVVKHPFFGSLALSLRVAPDTTIPTMCTDGKSILWSPDFVDGMDQEETVGVMAHEVMHVTMKHNLRRGDRDPELWNIACDFAINDILIEAGFVLPKDVLYDEQYKGLMAEAIFDRLPEDAKERFGQAASVGQVVDATNDMGNPVSQAEAKQMEADVDSKIMMAATGAKAVGNLPTAIKEMIERMKRSQVDWRDKMRRFVGGDQPDDYSMRKPQRKMYHMSGIVAPSIEKLGAGHLVALIDSSGSVSSSRELPSFLGEMNAISQDLKPKSITVITFDARVQTVRRYEQGEEIDTIELGGRGGTMVSPAFQYVEDKGIEVDNLVVFTDLCIYDFPDKPDYPVLWVSSWDQASPAPWGETTYIQA